MENLVTSVVIYEKEKRDICTNQRDSKHKIHVMFLSFWGLRPHRGSAPGPRMPLASGDPSILST